MIDALSEQNDEWVAHLIDVIRKHDDVLDELLFAATLVLRRPGDQRQLDRLQAAVDDAATVGLKVDDD